MCSRSGCNSPGVTRRPLSTAHCLLLTAHFHDCDPLPFALLLKNDATAERVDCVIEFGAAVRGEEERGVVLGFARGGLFERIMVEVLDGEDSQRAFEIAEV